MNLDNFMNTIDILLLVNFSKNIFFDIIIIDSDTLSYSDNDSSIRKQKA